MVFRSVAHGRRSSYGAAMLGWLPKPTQDPGRYEQLERVGRASVRLPSFAIYLAWLCLIASMIMMGNCLMPPRERLVG